MYTCCCSRTGPYRIHSLGVEFPRGRTLLPFYAVSAEDPTFTVLLGFWWLHFYQFTTPPKISLRRAGARWSLASTGTAVPTLACLSPHRSSYSTPPPHTVRSPVRCTRKPPISCNPRQGRQNPRARGAPTFTILLTCCVGHTFTILRQTQLTFTEPRDYGSSSQLAQAVERYKVVGIPMSVG